MASMSKNRFNACPGHHGNDFTGTQPVNGSEPDIPFGENVISGNEKLYSLLKSVKLYTDCKVTELLFIHSDKLN